VSYEGMTAWQMPALELKGTIILAQFG
jgi:ATP synthase assembly factor FMC1